MGPRAQVGQPTAGCRVFAMDMIAPPLVYCLCCCHKDAHAYTGDNIAQLGKTELVGELEDASRWDELVLVRRHEAARRDTISALEKALNPDAKLRRLVRSGRCSLCLLG